MLSRLLVRSSGQLPLAGLWQRLAQGLFACVLGLMVLGADSSETRFNRIGHKMMCACGCGQILLECNHVGCPDSDRMIGELRAQLAGGGSDTAVMNWFSAKYGAVILAAPMRGGFDRVAWIAPVVVFVLSALGTVVLVKVWHRRSGGREVTVGGTFGDGVGADDGTEALRERIRRDTEY